MKSICLSISLLLVSSGLFSQITDLHFDEEGNFKIVQFTDTHLGTNEDGNRAVYELTEMILEEENPDLVILTGDIVTRTKPLDLWSKYTQIFAEREIPWAAVLGNHDDENELSRKEIADYICSLPYSLNKANNTIYGTTNFILEVKDQGQKCQALLYCFDSNAYSTLKEEVKGYGWFDFSQIQWYREKSHQYTLANNMHPMPALAFFHIPLPEYTDAWETDSLSRIGVKKEEVCSPKINTGMYAAMLESGDVMATFVGHDHVNDYLACLYDIALAYGRGTGGVNTYGDQVPGARIIVLKEGKQSFDTWIREKGNKMVDPYSYIRIK